MIEPSRIRELNNEPERSGDYALYWMQASQRTRFNHALEYAIEQANIRALPLLVCFGLMDDYPEANERHYAFMLQGLCDVNANLAKRGIKFVVKHGTTKSAALHYGKCAAMIICDRGYLRHQRQWRDEVADRAGIKVIEVDSDIVVPVEEASDKREFAARTIRPKIHKLWNDYLKPLAPTKVKKKSIDLNVSGDLDVSDPKRVLKKLKLDRSVSATAYFQGGEIAAAKALKEFLASKLKHYADGRNEPSCDYTSRLGAYLHFGQISPIEMALAVSNSKLGTKADRDSFLEELIVRRELSINFVYYCSNYDSYDALPRWAKQTLETHRSDQRPVLYSEQQLEAAQTGDIYWNAAQREMVVTGFMHNYMRMYWGKKIIEWTQTPRKAFEIALRLNNKYFLCGRDPNSYASIGWLFGLHDRPWTQRKIFGTVRYMNSAGLERKFDMDAYVAKVRSLK